MPPLRVIKPVEKVRVVERKRRSALHVERGEDAPLLPTTCSIGYRAACPVAEGYVVAAAPIASRETRDTEAGAGPVDHQGAVATAGAHIRLFATTRLPPLVNVRSPTLSAQVHGTRRFAGWSRCR